MTCDLLVVGGGAAGLMCAVTAARRGLRVRLLEKNGRCGRKLLITGKGRCNVTNQCDRDVFLQNVRVNARFLYSALSQFSPADTMDFFERNGVPLKTERGRRVFPVSDRAADIVDCLSRCAAQAGVQTVQGAAERLLLRGNAVQGVQTADGRTLTARAVVLATGGASYPQTGSTGDGYRLAEQAGHSVVPPRASLVPVELAERDLCAELQGLALRNVTLSVVDRTDGARAFSELGELLFTHFGVSGPLVLSASAHLDCARHRLSIDCKPGLAPEQLDARLQRDFAASQNRAFRNALDALLPKRMIPAAVARSGVDPDKRVHQITRAERQALAAVLKDFSLTPTALRPMEEAVVTAGGVAVGEVDPKSMASRRCAGLYFAGELLDVDAYTGGYNLQIAFSTGYAAGSHALAEAKPNRVSEEQA